MKWNRTAQLEVTYSVHLAQLMGMMVQTTPRKNMLHTQLSSSTVSDLNINK